MKKVFSVLILSIALLSLVSSIEWPLGKSETCSIFNKTGEECDLYWCESINEGNYSVEKKLCVFYINETIVINSSDNESNSNINETYFLEVLGIPDLNSSVTEVCKAYTDNITTTLASNLAETIENKTIGVSNAIRSSDSESSSWSPWHVIIILAILIGFIAFLVFASKQQDNNKHTVGAYRRDFKNIGKFQGRTTKGTVDNPGKKQLPKSENKPSEVKGIVEESLEIVKSPEEEESD